MVAPLRFASCTFTQKCRFEAIGLLPQMMMSFACSNCSVSVPIFAPMVYLYPTEPAEAQIVLSKSEAPILLKNRIDIDSPCTNPMVPA